MLISRSKNKANLNTNQVSVETYFTPSAEVVANPLLLSSLLLRSDTVVLNYFLHQRLVHINMYYSQARVARMTGLTRETVNRSIKKLVSLGLLQKQYRHNSTCIYTTSPWFANVSVRQTLSKILPALYVGIFSLLSFIANVDCNERLTQVNKKNIYISSHTSTKRAKQTSSGYGFTTISIQDNYEPWYDDESLALPADIKAQFEHKEYESRKTQEKFHLNLGMKMHKVSDEASIMLLNGFTGFKLTVAGTARLTPFPAEALQFAEDNTAKMKDKTPQELFDAFYELCKTYCTIYRVQPSYDHEEALLKLYNLPQNAPYVEEKRPAASKPINIQQKPAQKVYERATYKNKYQAQEQAPRKVTEWQETKKFVEEDPYLAAVKIEKYRLTPDGQNAERLGLYHNPWFAKLSAQQQQDIITMYPAASGNLKEHTSILSSVAKAIEQRPITYPKNSYEDNMRIAKEYTRGKDQETQVNKPASVETYESDESPYDFIPPFDFDDGTTFDFI